MTYERRRWRSADVYYDGDFSDTYNYDDLSNSEFDSGYEDNVFENLAISGTNRSQETKVRPNITVRLCGNVPFCEPRTFVSCKDIPIKSCKQCSLVKEAFFCFFLFFSESRFLLEIFSSLPLDIFVIKKGKLTNWIF